ncbi:putative transposase [Nocardia farcinica IFM 10152]|uniref:Putative transposase n=1 Tax=Nocardia farcinica (strain IFM 10152) TaxID=247156 RepID=Q5YY31_NOCFA|nr:putative transposase [Nocardia farcinica IFM 10152]
MENANPPPTRPKDPSVLHRNAPLSIEGRRRLVQRCQHRPIAHVAAEMGISRQCASKWVNRWRRYGDLGLAFELHDEGTVIAVRTVTHQLAHLGLNRRRFLDPTGENNRAPRRIIARWPGHMVHVDEGRPHPRQRWVAGPWRRLRASQSRRQSQQRGAKAGYVYLHSVVDGYSRLAYTQAPDDEKADTAIRFMHRARAFLAAHGIGHIHRIVTDNGSCYRAHDFVKVLRGTRHQRIRPYTPRRNGKVERYQRILAEEFLDARTWTSKLQRSEALKVWGRVMEQAVRDEMIDRNPVQVFGLSTAVRASRGRVGGSARARTARGADAHRLGGCIGRRVGRQLPRLG